MALRDEVTAATSVVAVTSIVVALVLFQNWLLMLAVGVMHSVFEWPATTTGFWGTLPVLFVLAVVSSFFRSRRQ